MNINFNNMNLDMKRLFDKYVIFTEGQDRISIDYLAAAVSVPAKTAFAELQALVVMGYFGKEAYIDYFTKQLILRTSSSVGNAADSAKSDFSVEDFANTIKNTVINNVKTKSVNTSKQTRKKPAPEVPVISQKPYAKKGKLAALAISGGLLLFAAVAGATELIDSFFYGYFSAEEFIPLIFCTFLGIFCFVRRNSLLKLNSHFTAYRTIIGNKGYTPIKDLANAAGIKIETVKKDLQKFIDKGLLGREAYIDHSTNNLIISHSAYSKYKPVDDISAQKERNPEKDDSSIAKEAQSQYYEIIKEIRELNGAIPDPDVSMRIDKIEETTSKIFQIVEDKPEKLPEIRSFMSYYLPTTLKLLRSYAHLEKQGVHGDNIDAAKQNIEKVLDNVVKGFSQQLDQLFKSDYLDISTDIEVLESMMAKDGLNSDSGLQFKTK